jgi:hypothetical protein
VCSAVTDPDIENGKTKVTTKPSGYHFSRSFTRVVADGNVQEMWTTVCELPLLERFRKPL